MKTKTMPLETSRPRIRPAVFPPRRDYSSLSLKDLLDAREAYHVYLSQLENVVATAIGRYFIHNEDWYAKHPPGSRKPAGFRKPSTARTLANSVIRPWSWPAVLVFVKKWEQPGKLGENIVPKTLYLPDGRVVPVCVMEAEPDSEFATSPPLQFPTTPLIGGGYTCLREHQGVENRGTFACMVRKGGTYYALTNRHVAGGEGEDVRAYVRGQFVPVARTSSFTVDRIPMPGIFPSYGYSKSLLTMDAALARIEDINDWTSQAFGIGEVGEIFDATEYSLTLDLIGTPVCAYNGTSGRSKGEIQALFFCYESVGGYEYVTDVLIGPRQGQGEKNNDAHPFTAPGDSGTLWFYDQPADPCAQEDHDLNLPAPPPLESGAQAPRMRPIAMQWGGQRVNLPEGNKGAYALGTFLSSICRALDVELVRNWSTGHAPFWGKIGHFTIGWKACDSTAGKLKTLMKANQANIGFDDGKLSGPFSVDDKGFVPLADVPDYVWIGSGAHQNEGIQHFADIDIRDIDGNPPLLAQCISDPKKISAKVWLAYFDGFAEAGVGPEEGALPFRVWQIYEAMVGYVKKKDLVHFVAAAGILAHYVGDASQPLHCSFMHHGVPPMLTRDGRKYPVPKDSTAFKEFKKTRPSKIHGIYEEKMLEVDPANVLALVDAKIKSIGLPGIPIVTGHDAAVATLKLMHDAQKRLPPRDIFKADDPDLTEKNRAAALWGDLRIRKATITSLAESVLTLAALWKAAWKEGNGNAIPKTKLTGFDPGAVSNIYRFEKKFIPSLSLKEMAESGKFEP
jgi:hypothetical protein